MYAIYCPIFADAEQSIAQSLQTGDRACPAQSSHGLQRLQNFDCKGRCSRPWDHEYSRQPSVGSSGSTKAPGSHLRASFFLRRNLFQSLQSVAGKRWQSMVQSLQCQAIFRAIFAVGLGNLQSKSLQWVYTIYSDSLSRVRTSFVR